MGENAITISPTTPHTPQENAVAERISRTLISRVRATLHTAKLPFTKFWGYCILDTVSKTNSVIHDTIRDIPRRLWDQLRHEYSPHAPSHLLLSQFRMLGEYAHIPLVHTLKKKTKPRDILVRYLCKMDNDHYQVINPANGQITRIANYRPYNSNFDPKRMYHEVPQPTRTTLDPRVNAHHAIPCRAHQTTAARRDTQPHNPGGQNVNAQQSSTQHTTNTHGAVHQAPRAPQTLSQARKRPDARRWQASYEA